MRHDVVCSVDETARMRWFRDGWDGFGMDGMVSAFCFAFFPVLFLFLFSSAVLCDLSEQGLDERRGYITGGLRTPTLG
jgi:hypothetical protein